MKVHTISGHLFMTIYYLWNPSPDFYDMVIEEFPKLSLRLGIDYLGISNTANLPIVMNTH